MKGEAIVSLDAQSLIAQSWQQTSGLLIVMGVTLAALCLLVYAALARALRPTRSITTGLERLAANDLSARLADFDLAELSAIGAIFNSLAKRLQTTLAERNELTRRLIAVQDDERRHLARSCTTNSANASPRSAPSPPLRAKRRKRMPGAAARLSKHCAHQRAISWTCCAAR